MADFTERNPGMFIDAAEENGVDYAAHFGKEVNAIERVWLKLNEEYEKGDSDDPTFTNILKSLDREALQKLVLFGFYQLDILKEESNG